VTNFVSYVLYNLQPHCGYFLCSAQVSFFPLSTLCVLYIRRQSITVESGQIEDKTLIIELHHFLYAASDCMRLAGLQKLVP